jgi:hypothetical protein
MWQDELIDANPWAAAQIPDRVRASRFVGPLQTCWVGSELIDKTSHTCCGYVSCTEQIELLAAGYAATLTSACRSVWNDG